MKRLISLATLATLASVATIAQARDLGPDEAQRLRDAGTIKSFEQLNEAALAQHPGARIEETELEDEYGRYIYQIELRDTQGVQWDLELDASTGKSSRTIRTIDEVSTYHRAVAGSGMRFRQCAGDCARSRPG